MLQMAETVEGSGCIVEVGVYKGGTGWFLATWAQAHKRECFLYDTFTGIPYAIAGVDSHKVGDFGDTSFEAVRSNVPYATVVQGIFPASAVPMPSVAFVHLDVDQYQSYIDCCTYLEPLMSPGGVMWFDDPNCLTGARDAVLSLYGDRIKKAECDKWYMRF